MSYQWARVDNDQSKQYVIVGRLQSHEHDGDDVHNHKDLEEHANFDLIIETCS